MKSVYKFLSIVLLLVTPLTTYAQEVKAKKDSKNLLDYSMLNAYRPNQDSFSGSNVLMKHLYITGGIDFVRQVSKGNFKYNTGTGGYINVGTSFSSLWGGRISLGYNNIDEQKMVHSLRTFYGTVDGLLNLSSFVYGYKPSRLIESKAFFGVGWQSTRYEDANSVSPLLTTGLQFSVMFNKHTRLSLEPYALWGKSRVPYQADANFHHYDMNYGVRLGLQYNLNQQKTSDHPSSSIFSDLFAHSFFDLGVSSNRVNQLNSSLNGRSSIGGEIAFGRWVTPMAGLRIGLGMSHANWGSYIATTSQILSPNTSHSNSSNPEIIVSDPTSVIGLRKAMYLDTSLELLFNPLAGWRDASNDIVHFTFHGGLTIGTVRKSNFTATENARLSTTGWKIGSDFSLDMTPSIALYISPSFYKTSYAVPYSNYPESKSYDDERTQVQVGIRIKTNSLKFNHGLIPRLFNKAKVNQLKENNELKPQIIRLGGGISRLKSYTRSMAQSTNYGSLGYSIFGIYSLTSMSSIRASLAYNELVVTDLIPHDRFLKHTENVGEFGLDYLFNLSYLYANKGRGHFPYFKVEPFIGILLAKGLHGNNSQGNTIQKDFVCGYHAGLHISAPIWKKLSLFLQGEYKNYGQNFMHYLPTDYHRTLSLNMGFYWTL